MLTFQELGGSPTEQYTVDGFGATRKFLLPWEQRDAFALAVFGGGNDPGRLAYPGRNNVFAHKLRFEPFDPSAVNVRELDDLETVGIDYNGSHAVAVVDYATVETADRSDGPINEEGTSITYRMLVESQETELRGDNWRWGNNFSVIGGNDIFTKWIPTTIHYVTWSNVVDPPWTMISNAQGKVNNAVFLGCAPETLLFEGAEANKLYRPGAGLDPAGLSPFVWSIKYKFRERAVKMNGKVYGWNHFYRKEHTVWAEVYVDSYNKLYDAANFNNLFRSVLPDDLP